MPIYFDNNATTAVDPRVLEAMLPWLSDQCGNASSLHSHGRPARSAIDTAREQVAALVGAKTSEVIFTSGGTEANNLAVRGMASARKGSLAFSATEHPSVKESCEALAFSGRSVIEIPALANGQVDVPSLAKTLEQDELAFVSVMRANNETGVIQPIDEIRALTRECKVPLHCDAVQAAGKMPLSFSELAVDAMTVSAHKIYGPKGAGALVLKSNLPLTPVTNGGGQERMIRPGTENVAAIVGFGKAAELALSELNQRSSAVCDLRTALLHGLDAMNAGITVYGRESNCLPNTVQFSLPGFDGEALLMALDRHGVSVSSGSACASGKGEPSHVLIAMSVPEIQARGAIRVSLGKNNRLDEIETFLEKLAEIRHSVSTNMPSVLGSSVGHSAANFAPGLMSAAAEVGELGAGE